jgi:hypothetical protein
LGAWPCRLCPPLGTSWSTDDTIVLREVMRALLTSNLQLRNFNEFSSITEGGYNSRLLALLAHSSGIIPIFQSRGPCERSPGTGGTKRAHACTRIAIGAFLTLSEGR